MKELTIKNGTVYSGGQLRGNDIYVKDGIISEISINLPERGEIIDARGLVVSHGFIDLHTHMREPGQAHKETMKTGTMAAAAGGYTTICTMPNLNPVPDSYDHLEEQLSIIERDSVVNVLPYGAITVGEKGEEITDFTTLAPYVCGFSDDGKGVQSNTIMEEAMQKSGDLGVLIAAHCEDESLLHGGCIHDGKYAKEHGYIGISSESEYSQIERDIHLAEKYGALYHVCHISTAEGIDMVRQAKARGARVSCEATPHHIVLCETDIKSDSGKYKMNPPLRADTDREAIMFGILDGTIDCIATDHAPHSKEEKAKGLKGSAMGIVGIETAFCVLNQYLIKDNDLPIEKLLELMCSGGKIIDVPYDIKVGVPADIVLLDTEREFVVDSRKFFSQGACTPFDGCCVTGAVVRTFVDGKCVYNEQEK